MKQTFLYFGSNLKMYKTPSETAEFVRGVSERTKDFEGLPIKRFLIPSFPCLPAAGAANNGRLLLGAQNLHFEEDGQFTGEVSARMLEDLGFVSIIEIGHSERRHVFGESSKDCGKKVLAAVRHGFTALLCVGETAEEKTFSCSDEVLRIQLKYGLKGIDPEVISEDRLWIAYEPVWAIGVSGVPADADYVAERHAAIRRCLCELFGDEGNKVPILFGGSVNPGNANDYIVQENVDGLFVGRAAWTAEGFNALLRQVWPLYLNK